MSSQDTTDDLRPDRMLTFQQWCELLLNNGSFAGPDDRVMNVKEWAKAVGISEKNAKQVLGRGSGPKTVQLSANRIGIRVCDHRAWLTARTRKKAAA